jgi:signal transduction histidine kinase
MLFNLTGKTDAGKAQALQQLMRCVRMVENADKCARSSSRWSLRRQIRALGILFLATIVLACAFAVELVRNSDAARIVDAERQLERAAARMRERYSYKARAFGQRNLPAPDRAVDNRLLTSITASVLADMPRVEGGFYFSKGSQLLGYAYPTYQGSSPKTDIPPAEQPSILEVARQAVATGRAVRKRLDTASDTLLFQAIPLPGGAPSGAVWVMHHLEGVRGAYQWLNMAGLLVLLLVAGATTAAAWHITRKLDAGVSIIEAGLGAMEFRLEGDIKQTGIQELDRIATAIARLGQTLNLNQQRRAELEQKLRHADRLAALGRLIAGVAHEVRNPLASIKLKLHLAEQTATSDPARLQNAFAVIKSEVERIDRLVERLLALGKPQSASVHTVNIARYLAERLEAFEAKAAANGTVLKLRLSPTIDGAVTIDRDRLGEVMDNLIVNALEATKDGTIVVEAERDPHRGQLVIRVKDTGGGVSPKIRERLFEPFVTTKESGMGLGLFLSAELVRGMGGEVSYRELSANERNKKMGSCFEVRLPC